ncbi:MAG TPA: hypothetical protein VK485_06775 [Sphingomicrobium sp.]|nr:hypothetical protein [Sphingomicrobium sp.]
MNFHRQDQAAAARSLDRRIIQVDLPSDNAGVIAALRRAFQPAPPCRSEEDFEALLRRLN